jgi:hypothetical protein
MSAQLETRRVSVPKFDAHDLIMMTLHALHGLFVILKLIDDGLLEEVDEHVARHTRNIGPTQREYRRSLRAR